MKALLSLADALAFAACLTAGGGRLDPADCDPPGTAPPEPDCNRNGVPD